MVNRSIALPQLDDQTITPLSRFPVLFPCSHNNDKHRSLLIASTTTTTIYDPGASTNPDLLTAVFSPVAGFVSHAVLPLRVGMVLDQPFPPDPRVEREAKALVEAGYEVHLLCLQRSLPLADDDDNIQPEPTDEIHNGIVVHRVNPKKVTVQLPFIKQSSRLPFTGLYKIFSRAIWNIDTEWQFLIKRFVERLAIDILHVHDLRLVNTGLAVTVPLNLPLVADLNENYPALMKLTKGKGSPAKGKRAFKKWEHIEQQCAWQADHVITAVEEASNRLLAKGIPTNNLSIIPNTVDVAKFQMAEVSQAIVRRYKPYFLLTYVGNVNNVHRGLHTVLEAIALLKKDIPELFFVVAGEAKESYYTSLMQQAERLGIQRQLEFIGWMEETEFASYIVAADICLCPHLSNEQTETTFPNKLHLYHLFGKPVISSNCTPLARYIKESQGGQCYQSGNAQALADSIRQLYKDNALRRTMGENGRQSVLNTHNWQQSKQQLLNIYAELGAGLRPKHMTSKLIPNALQGL
jgi:glycosyltransferase involved in cell wall biosynthesis